MALQIEWTDKALNQLDEILNYWDKKNGTRTFSLKLSSIIQESLEVLSRYPESGRKTDNKLLRKKNVKNYYIYYAHDQIYLTVMGIWLCKKKL